MYWSSRVMKPFFSNSGMKSPGDMKPWVGCRQRTSASAPTSRSSLTLYLGCRYTRNCFSASAFSISSVMNCSRSSRSRMCSSYSAKCRLYWPLMLFTASIARSHICSTGTVRSVIS